MISIWLYSNASESNKLDKNLTLLEQLTGVFKTPTSYLTPVIILNVTDFTTLPDIQLCNYVYISDFSRYYFITDMVFISNDLVELHLKLDVLYTYRVLIRQQSALVSRNENLYSLLIEDSRRSYQYDYNVTEYDVPEGEKVNIHFRTNVLNQQTIILNTLANDQSLQTTVYTSPISALPNQVSTCHSSSYFNNIYRISAQTLMDISNKVIGDDSSASTKWASYIKSVIIYPFLIDYTGDNVSIRMGDSYLDATNIKGVRLNNTFSEYFICADFSIPSATSYLDLKAKYEIYLPYHNWVTLDPVQVCGKRLYVVYTTNYSDGSGYVQVITSTGNIIYGASCQLGSSVGVSSTNELELSKQRQSNATSLILTELSGALSTGVGIASGNPIAVMGGALSMTKGVTDAITRNNAMISQASCVASGSELSMYTHQNVKMRITKPRITTSLEDAKYKSLNGLPLCRTYTLSGLTGYTEIESIHLENFTNVSKTEQDEIETLLMQGVIL